MVAMALLTLNLLTTTIVAPPSNDSKWQTGFNSAFKGLNPPTLYTVELAYKIKSRDRNYFPFLAGSVLYRQMNFGFARLYKIFVKDRFPLYIGTV